MADNFNLRQFLTENKLTKNAQLLKEVSEAKYSDSYDSAASKKVSAHLSSTSLKDLDAAIAAAEEETGTKVTPVERRTLENQKHWMNRMDMEMERESVENKKPVMETKLTARERKLVSIVENALGIQREEDDAEAPFGRNKLTGEPLPDPASQMVAEDDMVQEKSLPKYENIEKLMQEIEAGTNEAAHSYKMKRMKEIAEMLEAKVGSLEEGEGADFVDAKKVKQMKKDIMTLRKQAEKLEKEYDKKFAKKEEKKETVKEGFDTELRDLLDMADRHAEQAINSTNSSIAESEYYPQYVERYLRTYKSLAEMYY